MTMDYCIPHMLFFKSLILTEYKTLEYSLSTRLLKELCVGHHSHISLKDLAANCAPYQHQCTMSKFWTANRAVALGYRISASWGHGFVKSAAKSGMFDCLFSVGGWVNLLYASILKCVQCVTCYQQSVVVLQFNMDQVKDKFLERLAIMEKDKKIIRY